MASNLVDVQSDPAHFDFLAGKHGQPFAVVTRHVDPVGIVVAEMEHDRDEFVCEISREALARCVLFALGDIPSAGEVRQTVVGADAFDHADQGVLLDPHFRSVALRPPGSSR